MSHEDNKFWWFYNGAGLPLIVGLATLGVLSSGLGIWLLPNLKWQIPIYALLITSVAAAYTQYTSEENTFTVVWSSIADARQRQLSLISALVIGALSIAGATLFVAGSWLCIGLGLLIAGLIFLGHGGSGLIADCDFSWVVPVIVLITLFSWIWLGQGTFDVLLIAELGAICVTGDIAAIWLVPPAAVMLLLLGPPASSLSFAAFVLSGACFGRATVNAILFVLWHLRN